MKRCFLLVMCLFLSLATCWPVSAATTVSSSKSHTDKDGVQIGRSAQGLVATFASNGLTARAYWDSHKRIVQMIMSERLATRNQTVRYEVRMLHATRQSVRAIAFDQATMHPTLIDSDKLKASLRVIPAVATIGELLLLSLIASSMFVVVSGVTYVALSEVVQQLRQRKNETYAAYLDKERGVFVGGPISISTAIARLNSNLLKVNNVWSTTRKTAMSLAQSAGRGRLPIFDLPHGNYPKYMPHYHRFDRRGGHSFFSY
jgi:hypothetical protein